MSHWHDAMSILVDPVATRAAKKVPMTIALLCTCLSCVLTCVETSTAQMSKIKDAAVSDHPSSPETE